MTRISHYFYSKKMSYQHNDDTEASQLLLATDRYENQVHDRSSSHEKAEARPLPLPLHAQTSDSLSRNFMLMSIGFAINHGCVVSCLTYATTELGDNLGGYSSGFFMIFYAFSAFLLSKPLVNLYGPKNGILIGQVGYCIYILGFLFAVVASYDAAWVSKILQRYSTHIPMFILSI
jgi:hypothetical protein